MFPIRDDNPTFLTPYVTYGIIAVNAIVWVLVQGMGTDPMLSRSVCELGLIPGALLGTVPAGTEFQPHRLLCHWRRLRLVHAVDVDVYARGLVARYWQHVVHVGLRR
jgi:membrane associated rhomboid family serine protease